MNALDRRLLRLESSGRFRPNVQAMSDDEVIGLLVAAGDDRSLLAAILERLSDEQVARFEAALEQLAATEAAT